MSELFLRAQSWLAAAKTVLIGLSLISFASYAQIEITDSHGKTRFNSPPQRVVSLNWALTENLFELDVIPVGVAELDEFKKLSTIYTVPPTVQDLGPRLGPDLAAIKQLEPDLILIGYSQRSLIRTLSNIAPVIYFRNFSTRYRNTSKADERFVEMAKLFQKERFARQKLKDRDQHISKLAKTVARNYAAPLFWFVAPASSGARQIALFGDNSMVYGAAKQLDIKVGNPGTTDGFGVVQTALSDVLSNADKPSAQPACFVILASSSENAAHYECQYRLSYQQAFGGAMSLSYLAQAIADVYQSEYPNTTRPNNDSPRKTKLN